MIATLRTSLSLGLVLFAASGAVAHPIPENTYDRTIVVRLLSRGVVVNYRLEVDSQTAYLDVPHLIPKAELRKLDSREEVLLAFVRASAADIAYNLDATVEGKRVVFACTSRKHEFTDHLICDYVFEANWPAGAGRNSRLFKLRELNYTDEKGAIKLSLTADDAVNAGSIVQPDAALLTRSPLDFRPGDADRLRTVEATLDFEPPPSDESPKPTSESGDVRGAPSSLKDLLFQTQSGLWVVLGLAALFGGAHALTPGHGKTLVAAYLVGERGTVGHAVLLGLVVTLTHTGAVLLVAAVLPLLFPGTTSRSFQTALEFISGLLIAVLGFWLLTRRLSGKADHVHLFGGHHHHGRDHHDEHVHLPPGQPVRMRDLILLGVSGGIVPCGEAVVLFSLAVQWQRLDLAFPLLLAFSAGLALVLVGIGVGVVLARRFSIEKWGESPGVQRIARVLPIVSAVVVTVIGVWLCYQSIHESR